MVWPKEGSLSIQRPIAIMADAGRSEAEQSVCQEFIDYVISSEAQTIMAKYGFIPVRADVAIPEGVPSNVKSINLDWQQVASQGKEIRSNFEKIMLAQ